jgi:hypothetical protein
MATPTNRPGTPARTRSSAHAPGAPAPEAPEHHKRLEANGPGLITLDDRRRMIADAAYYRAQHRSFISGYELRDWLDAEAEIDDALARIC